MIIDKLNKEVNAILAEPTIKQQLAELGGMPITGWPADLGKLIAAETEQWEKLAKFAGTKWIDIVSPSAPSCRDVFGVALSLCVTAERAGIRSRLNEDNNAPIFKPICSARFFMALCRIFPASLSMFGGAMVVKSSSRAGDRIIEPMIALAECSKQDRILIAGAKAIELMLDMHHRGYAHAVATANCGRPAGQYDIALVDWRRRPFRTLEQTLDWMLNYVNPRGTILIWVDPQKPAAIQNIHLALEKRGLVVENDTTHECGCAVSARRHQTTPLKKAA